MTELSFAAQAVWDAAWANTPVQCGDIEGTRRAQVAAALRAAADQIAEMYNKKPADIDNIDVLAIDELERIAAELEGAQ